MRNLTSYINMAMIGLLSISVAPFYHYGKELDIIRTFKAASFEAITKMRREPPDSQYGLHLEIDGKSKQGVCKDTDGPWMLGWLLSETYCAVPKTVTELSTKRGSVDPTYLVVMDAYQRYRESGRVIDVHRGLKSFYVTRPPREDMQFYSLDKSVIK